MLLAYKRRLIGNKASRAYVADAELVFFEEDWRVGRTMGSAKRHASRTMRKGFGVRMDSHGHRGDGFSLNSYEIADVRIIPDEAAQIIRHYDEDIAMLQSQRQAFVEDNFRTFALPTIEQCSKTFDGMSKQKAEAAAKQANKDSPIQETTLASERRINDALVHAINDTALYRGKK